MRKILAMVLFCVAFPAAAAGMRCGQSLLELGDSMSRVEQSCGTPAEKNEFSAPYYYIDNRGNRRYGGVQVYTECIYNFGPQRFMMKVKFVGGKITNFTELGYGS